MNSRFAFALWILGYTGAAMATQASPLSKASTIHWSDETPDAMADDAVARALASGATPRAQMAALAMLWTLSDRTEDGHARQALERIAAAPAVDTDVRGEAALLARTLSPDETTEAGSMADEHLGVVDSVALLGPFRDTGGGVDLHDGPEADGRGFTNTRATYSWGAVDVAWRTVPRAFATAEGIPLDLFVAPRKESCTWLATELMVDRPQKIVAHLAASGQARLVYDGHDIARDIAVAQSARFDRLAARIDATLGLHWLAAKVCSGALDDDGRVRLRVTDDAGLAPSGVTARAATAAEGGPHGANPGSPRARSPGTHDAVHERSQTERPSITTIPTPLGRALAAATSRTPAEGASQTRPAAPMNGDADAALEIAVLRTLGGADDMRSPRAPGMLAALVDGPIDADRRAIAAWITPSGANRSAWLSQAQSDPTADAATRAFVGRRLVERRIEATLSDWAIATLRSNRIDAAHDAEAALLTAQCEAALGTEALRLQATRRLETMARAQNRTPDAVLRALAELASPLAPALSLWARERLAARGDVGSDLVTASESRGAKAVVTAARRAFDGGVQAADDALAIAQSVARAGDHDEAQRLFEKLTHWAPNKAAAWAGLAHETSALQSDPTREEVIAAALRRARELDPADARDRAELSLRTRAPASGEPHDDDKYLVSPQTFLSRRTPLAIGGPPDVADRELHWLRALVMHPDRRVSELVHYAREIVIAPRTEDELYEDIPAEGDLTEIVRARVHRKDGATAFPVEETSDGGHPRIRWPELERGDVVEVAFRSWTAGPVGGRGDPPFYRLDYAGALSTHPVLYNEVDIESPADHPVYVDVVHGHAERREEKDENNHHRVRLVWDHPTNVPDEPNAPPLSEVVPTVVISTFRDWNAFRAWYAEAVRGFTEPDAQVRALAAKLTAGKGSQEAKLRAIFDFVADDIRYVNYVSGEWWLPNRPQQLLARREGDCDDKALLLITLLRAVGIDAEEVLVQTRMTAQPSILKAPGAAIPLFDHGIAFLNGPHGGTYLDATSPQSRLGPLPSMDARAVALRMNGPAEIVELPPSIPEEHGIDSTWRVALTANDNAELEGQDRASGDDAFWMRTYLTEPGPRAEWLEEHMVGPWFPTVHLDKKVGFQGDLANGTAVVDWRGRSRGFTREEGAERVVPLAPEQTLASQLAPLVSRTLPVWLPPEVAPRKESRTIRIAAPSGWTLETLPSGGDENGGVFGRAHLEVTRDPSDSHTLIVKRVVVFDRSTIAVDEYPAWRAWLQRVDALMHRSVRYRVGGGR